MREWGRVGGVCGGRAGAGGELCEWKRGTGWVGGWVGGAVWVGGEGWVDVNGVGVGVGGRKFPYTDPTAKTCDSIIIA